MFFSEDQVDRLESESIDTESGVAESVNGLEADIMEMDVFDLIYGKKNRGRGRPRKLKTFIPLGMFKFLHDNINKDELDEMEYIVDEENIQLFEREHGVNWKYKPKPDAFKSKEGKFYKYYPKMLIGYVLEEVKLGKKKKHL
jgi:hypothetical protein